MGAAVLVGSLLQSATGFGLAAICVPVGMALLGPREGVVVALALNVVAGGMAIALTWPRVTTAPGARPLISGSLLGIPVGALLLASLSADALRVSVAVLLLLMLLPDRLGRRSHGPWRPPSLVLAGGVTGLLHSGAGLGQPAAALVLNDQGMPKDDVRAGMAAITTVTSVASLVILSLTGVASVDLVLGVAAWLPALVVGMLVGAGLAGRLPATGFHRLTRITVVGAVVLSMLVVALRAGGM